ncbi:MAG: phospholipase D-like domain-containing protein, partial [Tannerellaceae bacterium]
MEVKFIAQGISEEHTSPLGYSLAEALKEEAYHSFSAFVAFVSVGGIKNIEDQLIKFKSRGGDIRLYIGVDLHGTSKEALEKLLELEIPTYIVFSPNGIIYHPKVYSFQGEEQNFLSVGSSNLTTSGLYQNVEASVCFNWNKDDEQGIELYSDVCEHFNLLLSQQTMSCQQLNREIIDLLVNNKIVLSEATSRAITNQVKKENETTPVTNNEKLLEVFGKLKISRPPKGHKKTVKKETIDIVPNEESTISFQISELQGSNMWIECGQMTGASRNILDLSKKGKRDNIDKFGSVEFFGVDKDAIDQSVDIDILYNGKTYTGNYLFFAADNSNWRIQLKGIADDGSKLTDISRPQFGNRGGFQGRIILFGKTTTENTYLLSVVGSEELDKLREISSDWA